MNDHDALLLAICEHPEEDTPRLLYADWLEEHGQSERADFVRNQVAMAQPGLAGAELYAVTKKNRYYLSNFVRQWQNELPRIDGIEWGDFNRGVIEEVRAKHEGHIIDHAAEIFVVPGIHVLRLWRLRTEQTLWSTNGGYLLSRVPELIRLRTLCLIHSATSQTLCSLFESPHLRKLTALDLYGSTANDRVVAQLVGGRFPDLAELQLGGNYISAAGAMALVNSPHLTKLRLLDLRGNQHIDYAARTALQQRFGSALKM